MSEQLDWKNIKPGHEDDVEVAHAMALSENASRDEYQEALVSIKSERLSFSDKLRNEIGSDESLLSEDELDQLFEEFVIQPIKLGVEKIGPKLSERAGRQERGEYFGDDVDAPYVYSSADYLAVIKDMADEDPETADLLMGVVRAHFAPGGKHADEIFEEARALHDFEVGKAA